MERLGRMPCANSALLYGIGTGSVVGLGTYLLRRTPVRLPGRWSPATAPDPPSARPRTPSTAPTGSVMKSCNYAVAAFAAVGILSFEKCQADRKRVQEEQAKLALAVSLTKKYHEQQRQKSSAGATGPLDPRVDVQPGPPPAAGDDGGAAAPPAPPLGPKVAN